MSSDVEELATRLTGPRVCISELRKAVGQQLSDLRWRKLLWHAVQMMRERRGIEFITQGDWLVAAAPDQALRRGLRFNRTGLRKVKRSLAVLDAVDAAALSSDERATLERAVTRIGRSYNFAIAAARDRSPEPHELEAAPRAETLRGKAR